MTKLIYTGRGEAIIGVPARDLTENEVNILSAEFDIENLIASGLYKKEQDDKKPIKKSAKDGE